MVVVFLSILTVRFQFIKGLYSKVGGPRTPHAFKKGNCWYKTSAFVFKKNQEYTNRTAISGLLEILLVQSLVNSYGVNTAVVFFDLYLDFFLKALCTTVCRANMYALVLFIFCQ